MTDTTSSGSDGKLSVEKRFDMFHDYVKTVLSLSTGALILSITFLHEIIGVGRASPAITYKPLLGICWGGFLVSVIGSLFYLYFLALASKFPKAYSTQLNLGAIACLGGFVVGLLFLAVFGWLHIP